MPDSAGDGDQCLTGCERGALHVAVAEREHLGPRLRVVDEGVTRRRFAVIGQAQDLAGVVVQRLCPLHLAAVAERHVHDDRLARPGVEHDARAEVLAGAALGRHAEHHLHLLHAPGTGRTRELAARHLGAVAALGVALRVAPVDPAVARVLGVRHHVHQPALPLRVDARQAGYRRGVQLAVPANHAQAARPLGDQHAAVGQEGKAPGPLQALGDGDQADRVLTGGHRLG